MKWEGSEGWNAAEDVGWARDGDSEAAGTYATFGPLSFVKVYDAGHMVRPFPFWLQLSGTRRKKWTY
jgi:carboxypeptidase C (cathepsin A)